MYVPKPSEKDILDKLENIDKKTLPIALFCTGLPLLAIGLFNYLTFFNDILLGKPNIILDKISGLYLVIGFIFLGSAFALYKRRTNFRRWVDIAIWVLLGIMGCLAIAIVILLLLSIL